MTNAWDRLMDSSTLEDDAPAPEAPTARLERLRSEATTAEPKFRENCPKCRGTGQFRSYSGRAVGQCFACKGRGFNEFKTSAADRAKARDKAAAKKQANVIAWVEAYPAEWLWIAAAAPRFAFAQSMMNAVTQYGSLTEKQLAAVQKLMAKDADRNAEREAQRQQAAAAAPVICVEAIEDAFTHATGEGLRFPKLRLDTFIFSLAGPSSKNAGAIYVKEGGEYLGKIVGAKFFRVRACSDEQEQRIVAAAADPAAAAKAYGLRTGQCSCCGKELTNKVSIELGIGPVCRSKYGWGA